MILRPAVHISFFGVFPTEDVDDILREGFTAEKAAGHAAEVARTGTLTEAQIERLIKGMPELKDMIDLENFESAQDMQDNIRLVSHRRMRAAYQMAANKGWIEPLHGAVFLAPPVDTDIAEDLPEEMERAAFSQFQGYTNNSVIPALVIPGAGKTLSGALTGMAYIRCFVDGRSVTMSTFKDQRDLFASLTFPHSEPSLDIDWFDMRRIDTVTWCNSQPGYRTSRFMGYNGTAKPPAPFI